MSAWENPHRVESSYDFKTIIDLIRFCGESFNLSSPSKVNRLVEMNILELEVAILNSYDHCDIEKVIETHRFIIAYTLGYNYENRKDVSKIGFISNFIRNLKNRDDAIASFVLINLLRRSLSEEREPLSRIIYGQSLFYEFELDRS